MSSRYFDHNATTPLCPAAREAWLTTADQFWHNPSSLYPDAGAAKRRLEDARETLADLLGIDDESHVVFTSGATEANNAAIAAIAADMPGRRAAISAVEHPSVLAPARRHFGERLDILPTDPDGQVELAPLRETALVALMAANNETGVVQPCAKIVTLARENGGITLCDASQWFGKRPARDAIDFGDIIVGSAHKFGGPKGTGFAVLGDAAEQLQLQTGGPQESRHRAGTEDLPGIAAMIAALEVAEGRLIEVDAQSVMRDAFEQEIHENIPGSVALGVSATRLPNTSMIVMPEGKNLKWLTRLGRRGFAISTGSACSSGAESGSHVLAAMNLPAGDIDRALRISSGATHTAEDWRALADTMTKVWSELAGGDTETKPTIDFGSL